MTMQIGVVMLVHQALDRAAQVARHWAVNGCPVVLHVDAAVPAAEHDRLVAALADLDRRVVFSRRHRCEWGMFSIVAATQDSAVLLLERFPEVERVLLTSGTCLPLRPAAELREHLAAHPETDFIESVRTEDVVWPVGGLDEERFSLHFPVSWRRNRWLFDRLVHLQRRLGVKRRMPGGLAPHMGSQWWCLTRRTLTAILDDPDRRRLDRFFRRVWIPDESYFQTLARRHSDHIESRSLTLGKFDFQGKPHIFYDDHLDLLRDSGFFLARKIWPRAERLYATFLADVPGRDPKAQPDPRRVDRVFARARDRRTKGRPGLAMQSRFPGPYWGRSPTAAPFSVFQGHGELVEGFADWLESQSGAQVHGHLFARPGAEFAGGAAVFAGSLSDAPKLRDYNPQAFLGNLVWNSRGRHQAFLYGPADRQQAMGIIAADPHARIHVISGAWLVPLERSSLNFARRLKIAARHQRIEGALLEMLRSQWVRARVEVMTLSEFLDNPLQVLRAAAADIGPARGRRIAAAPKLRDLGGLPAFIQALRNEGMDPHLAGEISALPVPAERTGHGLPRAVI